MTRSLLVFAGLVATAATAAAQVPAGGEFTVNTYTTGDQVLHAMTPLAMGPGGEFVVAWGSEEQEAAGGFGVYAQRFDASAARMGAEFHVNQFTAGYQGEASLAFLGRRGRFVVAWESEGADGSLGGVCARIFDGAGVAQTPEFLVNTFTPSDQLRPAVAADAAGNFVVVWTSDAQDGYGAGVFGQRFGPAGNRLGAEFAVNTHTSSFQNNPAVAFTSAGQFVVTWASYGQEGSGYGYGLFAQRFDAAGSRLGAEFQVSTDTDGPQGYHSAIAPAAGGGFVVTWDNFRVPDGIDVAGQRFDSAGARVGAEFLVNTFTTGTQFWSRVASDAAGGFTVAWGVLGSEAAKVVSAQRFDASGAKRGGEFRVSASTTGEQQYPGLGADAVGNFVVAWNARDVDGSGYATQAQRFGGLRPAALAVDPSGNGVLEPGESPDVRPSWRNVNGAPQLLAGMLLDITGPAGAGYGLPDPGGSYGVVADGATRECLDCYGVSVSDPPTRPLLHWDAATTEAIVPDAQGQRQIWRLHVGDSFTDVPPASGFYRFVETLLHHGITGGCTGTSFCPASSTTREQMAVFVLAAKEGAGYTPAPCGAPVFADVPPSSPFCLWIEELARRGVTGGCGGGNYCPAQAVTREQMAIFVLRTLDPALAPPACTVPVFADVPPSSPFCRWIEELARRGVVSGCGGGNYCPAGPVTREQMSVFISVTFGLTLYGP